jgi:hypothetical protein
MRIAIWRYAGGTALLALALAGCDSAAPSTTPPPAGASASTVAPSPVPTLTPSAPDSPAASPAASATSSAPPRTPTAAVAVQLVRSGGFAGGTVTIAVKPDGSWTRSDGRRGRLSAAQRARLQALAKDPRLPAEGARATSGTVKCNDTYTYLLRVGSKAIKYEQCPGNGAPPKVTLEIIGLLQDATG